MGSARGSVQAGVRVHKGITIVLSLFRIHWLAAVYCLVLCEPVHQDRKNKWGCLERVRSNVFENEQAHSLIAVFVSRVMFEIFYLEDKKVCRPGERLRVVFRKKCLVNTELPLRK